MSPKRAADPTFQTISYTFDVYRRRIEPEQNPITFATYVAYFPQLVAGPIERAQHLLPQIQGQRRAANGNDVGSGLRLILIGLFKKVAIADAAAPLVSKAFDSPSGSVTATIGILAFSLQIYGDFSGYTDIARGTSRLFGIDLIHNFRQPYLSRNITEFWRTWHISLSDWLHDYLYVSLGGNRRGRLITYRNLMITMLLGGLWHGASWNFVIWGGLHGLYLAVERSLGRSAPRGSQTKLKLRHAPSVISTFALVSVTWVFFRARDLDQALDVLRSLVSPPGSFVAEDLLLVVLLAIQVFALDLLARNQRAIQLLGRNPFLQGLACGALALGVVLWSGGDGAEFIYFQF